MWASSMLYGDDYINRRMERAAKIREEKGDQLTYKDFSSVDILHVCGHEGLTKFFDDYPHPPDSLILEVGCGLGGSSRYLHFEKGFRMFGFDYIQQLVDGSVVINKWLNVEDKVQHVQGDACTFPYEAGHYDCAFAVGVFLHIDSDEGLLNTCRALKPGGLFYIEDYYFVKNRSDFTDEEREMISQWGLFGTKSKEEMRAVLEGAGMEVLEMSEFGQVWSRASWNRANLSAKGYREGTLPLSDKEFRQLVQIAPLLTYDFDESVEELRQQFPELSREIDIEYIITQRPKFTSMYRVVARKRA